MLPQIPPTNIVRNIERTVENMNIHVSELEGRDLSPLDTAYSRLFSAFNYKNLAPVGALKLSLSLTRVMHSAK